jgi:hypothetical protein
MVVPRPRVTAQDDAGGGRVRVLDHVLQRLLGDPVEGDLDVLGQRALIGLDGHLHASDTAGQAGQAIGQAKIVQDRRAQAGDGGLLPLHTKLARACFDATVYPDPPEEIRRAWKVSRDTAERGYTAEAVLAELERREAESAAFIQPQRAFAQPQRAFADIVIRFAPIPGRVVPKGTPLSAELMLRPTIRHPDLDGVVPEDIADGSRPAIHLKLARDADGRPVDALHIHVNAARTDSDVVEKAIWSRLGAGYEPPACLGRIREGQRTEPLAITQLLLVYHLLDAARRFRARTLSC